MNILAIDTTTETLGIALVQNQQVKIEYIAHGNNDHAVRLMPSLVNLMEQIKLKPNELNAIVVSSGPGSYTGTRIGITTAKTMAWSLNIPVYSISSLASLSVHGRYFDGLICPLIDARRDTVYTSLYRWKKDKVIQVEEDTHYSISEWLGNLQEKEEQILFVSPHIDMYKERIESAIGKNAICMEQANALLYPSFLVQLMNRQKDYHVVHEVNPNYLRITEAEANLAKDKKG